MQERFPYFIQSDKTLIPEDCAKSHAYIAIPRAATKKIIHRDIFKFKNTLNKQNWRAKK